MCDSLNDRFGGYGHLVLILYLWIVIVIVTSF